MVTVVTPVKVDIIKVIMVTNLGNFPKYHQFIFIINYENWCAAWLFLSWHLHHQHIYLSLYCICDTLYSYFRRLLTASIFPCLSWSNTTSLLPFHFDSSREEHFVISNSHLKIHMVDMKKHILSIQLLSWITLMLEVHKLPFRLPIAVIFSNSM